MDSGEQCKVCVTKAGIQMNFRAEIRFLIYLFGFHVVSGKKRQGPFFSRERMLTVFF